MYICTFYVVLDGFIEGMTDDIALVKHLIMDTGDVWTTMVLIGCSSYIFYT
jgi:hypothetical protein